MDLQAMQAGPSGRRQFRLDAGGKAMDLKQVLAEVAAGELSVAQAAEQIRRLDTRPRLGERRLREALLCIAMGSLCAGIGLWFAVQWYRFASIALRTEGTVVRLVSGGSGTVAPVVRYQAGAQPFEFPGRVYSQPAAYSVGDKVSVLYQPNQPGTG